MPMDRFARYGFHWLERAWIPKEQKFGLLVIGETGAGKSTLINNLLGENVAKVGKTTHAETSDITKHDGNVRGIDVRIYDTPGLFDCESDPKTEEAHLKKMGDLMKSGDIAGVIFCFNMTTTRIRQNHIHTFKTYQERLPLKWNKVIIALTFADKVVDSDEERLPAVVFNEKFKELKDRLVNLLRKDVGVAVSKEEFRIHPVTKKYTTKLPDGEDWFKPLWFSMLEILDSEHMFYYLRMHFQNVQRSEVPPTPEEVRDVNKQISASDHNMPDQLPSSHPQPSHPQPRIIVDNPEDDERLSEILQRGFIETLKLPYYAAKGIVKCVKWGWNIITGWLS